MQGMFGASVSCICWSKHWLP